jgi:hypothetical protein
MAQQPTKPTGGKATGNPILLGIVERIRHGATQADSIATTSTGIERKVA